MPDKSDGELVQEYVRSKWERTGSPEKIEPVGQELGPALRSRIDVLGTDSLQLLTIAPDAVLQKLEDLEHSATLEDLGMIEKATRSADRTVARSVGRSPLASKKRKRTSHPDTRRC